MLWCGSVNLGDPADQQPDDGAGDQCGGARRAAARCVFWLLVTAALGFAFLCVKGYEYYLDYQDKVVPVVNFESKPGEGPAGELFWMFYLVATGLHAIHLSIGIGLVLYMLCGASGAASITAAYYAPLEVVGALLELCRYRLDVSLSRASIWWGAHDKVRSRSTARRSLPFVVAWLVLLLLAGVSMLSAFLGPRHLGADRPVRHRGDFRPRSSSSCSCG